MESLVDHVYTYGRVPYRPMIILEGVDGSGKSTLAEWLSGRLGLPVRSRLCGSDGALEDDYVKQELSRLHAAEPGVYDRSSAISEFVYGPVLGELHPDAKRLHYRLWTALRDNALVVYVRPPAAWAKKNAELASERQAVLDKFPALVRQYDDVMSKLPVLGLRYDPTAPGDLSSADIEHLVAVTAAVTALRRW